jgi:hypothetical protein
MKRGFWHILIVAFCCSFFAGGISYATDEEGCLICHRYPGLVKREKGEAEFKALHIDEKIYLASKHGKFSCRKCHTKIYSIPHTGQTGVDCTTECHRSEKDQKLIKDFKLADFHKNEQSYIVTMNDNDSCRVCHPIYPHEQDKIVRAVLNMHTGFMACEVCHIKKLQYSNITYGWKDTMDVKFHGNPFGSCYNPKTGETQPSGDIISRIVPFTTDKNGKKLLMNTWDTEEAKKFNAARIAAPEEKSAALARFHRDIDKKEVSVACEECHSSSSILDFRELGFDEGKAETLITIDIKGLITKYKTFYMPKLFGVD